MLLMLYTDCIKFKILKSSGSMYVKICPINTTELVSFVKNKYGQTSKH